MDFKMLRELVKQGEGKRLEFKLKSNHPEKIVREIVAFANSDGGWLLVGVGDDKTIKGLKYAEEDEYLLVCAIEKYIYPQIEYTVQYIAVGDEREVLAFNIPTSPNRPHSLLQEADSTTVPIKTPTQPKKVYVRVADKSVQASWEVKEILRRSKKNQDIKFQYGQKEQTLMQYLGQNGQITVDVFAQIAQISRKQASKTLVLLVLANVLKIHPDEIKDTFSMTKP